MAKVREDEFGILVIAGGYIARPGGMPGYDHVPTNKMDAGGVIVGSTVEARHIAGTPLTKVTAPDGLRLWHHYEKGVDPEAVREARRPKPGDQAKGRAMLASMGIVPKTVMQV